MVFSLRFFTVILMVDVFLWFYRGDINVILNYLQLRNKTEPTIAVRGNHSFPAVMKDKLDCLNAC